MKNKLESVARKVATSQALKQSLSTLKPDLSIGGVLGVLFFFIIPEIVGFIWGVNIAAWAHAQVFTEPSAIGRSVYWMLEKIFKNGGSWINLTVGILLLGWLLKDWIQNKIKKESNAKEKEYNR